MPTAWCVECGRSRIVMDQSIECDDGSGQPDFRQQEYHVTTLACGHEIVGRTGKSYDRIDGLVP